MGHDPHKQSDLLHQALEQEKRPFAMLLGAGCPLSIRVQRAGADAALIPDIAGLTKTVADELGVAAESPYQSVVAKVTSAQPAGPNIEEILSHVRLMKQVVGSGELYGLNAKALTDLESSICNCIKHCVNQSLPSADTPYHKLATWITSTNRTCPVSVFTTNYDLLMEQAFEDLSIAYFDGFIGGRQPFFDLHAIEQDTLPPRWVRLWKIHGSVNWHQNERGVQRGDITGGLLIYPSHLKYDQSRRMPYLAMMDQLRAFLRQPGAVLITCGYSFADQHINDMLLQGLEGNNTAMVFGLLYGTLDLSSPIVQKASVRGNLSLLARDKAVIGRKLDDWKAGADEASDDSNPAVEWLPQDPRDSTSRKLPHFRLGDFARFAVFLERVATDKRSIEHA